MTYKVAIRKNETGEVRIRTIEGLDWHKADGGDDMYWWTEGNFGCDCNRELEFERAGGNDPNLGTKCGDERYSVLYAELPDGTRIEIDTDDAATSPPKRSQE